MRNMQAAWHQQVEHDTDYTDNGYRIILQLLLHYSAGCTNAYALCKALCKRSNYSKQGHQNKKKPRLICITDALSSQIQVILHPKEKWSDRQEITTYIQDLHPHIIPQGVFC